MADKFLTRGIYNKVWNTFYDTSETVMKYADETFTLIGISLQQFIVLSTIKDLDPPVTQSTIARRVNRNPYSITLIIDRMEKDGLVKRVKDLKDRRSSRLVVTAKGEKMYERAYATAKTIPENLLSCMSREELLILDKYLKTLNEKAKELRSNQVE